MFRYTLLLNSTTNEHGRLGQTTYCRDNKPLVHSDIILYITADYVMCTRQTADAQLAHTRHAIRRTNTHTRTQRHTHTLCQLRAWFHGLRTRSRFVCACLWLSHINTNTACVCVCVELLAGDGARAARSCRRRRVCRSRRLRSPGIR